MDSVIFLSWTIALSCESSSDTGFSLPDTIHTFIHRKVLIKIMNIAICDDEILFTRELSSLLTHWAEKNDFSLTLYPYSNGDDLLTALRTIPVDLIFLDIIMPLLNGIDTAREIRSMGLTVPVIFLTSSREFALDSYDVKAFHYLLKPVNTLKLFSVMDDFFKTYHVPAETFIAHTTDGFCSITLNDVDIWKLRINRFWSAFQMELL